MVPQEAQAVAEEEAINDGSTTEEGLSGAYEEEQKRTEELKRLAYSLMPKDAVAVVEGAKAKGVQPYTIQLGDEFFVYRTFSRLEYRDMLVKQASISTKIIEQAEDQTAGRLMANIKNEDAVVCRCVLYPIVNELNVKEYPAGYVETLHNSIMFSSGFNQEPIPVKL